MGDLGGLTAKDNATPGPALCKRTGEMTECFRANHARTRIVAYGIGYALYRGVGSLIHHNGEADNAGHYQGTTGRGERGTDGTG